MGLPRGFSLTYRRPLRINEWKIDDPDGELYMVSIMDDGTVISAYGRCAYRTGCKVVSWSDFLHGEMNDLVEKTMGNKVLHEVLDKLQMMT